jgi:anaerobic ribonucleoside-triphosphate reductase activating protein
MNAPRLRLHRLIPRSYANGPGVRAVLWVQGCSLGCAGCFNPETHAFAGGYDVAPDDLCERIAALGGDIEGVTVSGGEPLQQPRPLLALLQRLRRETALSVLVFTGFAWEEVQRLPAIDELLACVDVLIAGRYDASRHLARHLRGSANKTVHFLTNRYGPADLERVPPGEVIVTPAGEVEITGADSLRW